MSDKMRSGFSIAVNFTDGELPTAAKLRGVARQAKSGLGLIEYALGDPWNQGADTILTQGGTSTENALMIPNVSRFLGATKNLNPRIPYVRHLNSYTHKFYVGDNFVGTREAVLSLKPSAASTYVWTGTSCPTSQVTHAYDVNSTGEFFVDATTGHCVFFDEIGSDWKVVYTPDITDHLDLDDSCNFNVMPDPDTDNSYGFLGCKIAYTNNTDNTLGYIIFLPPRGPCRYHVLDRGPQSPYDSSSNTDNLSATPDVPGTYTFWQDSAQPAATDSTTAEHYRYVLPDYITSYWSQASQLPAGLAYLWDHSQTQTIITGTTICAENVVTPRTWCVIVTGAAMDTWVTNYMTACGYPADSLTNRDTHTASYYPASGLRLVTIGSSVSNAVDHLLKKFWNHKHSATPEGLVNHTNLTGTFHPTSGLSGSQQFVSSGLSNDDHPQYVHRAGIGSRDPFQGGMFSDLLFLSQDATTNYQNVLSNSNGLYFGDTISGARLYLKYISNLKQILGVCSASTSFAGLYIDNGLTINQRNYTWAYPHISFEDTTKVVIQHETSEGDGALTVCDPNYASAQSNGSLICNRHKAGSYLDSDYGYSDTGGLPVGYGRVREWIVDPAEFIQYLSNTTDEESNSVEDLVVTNTVYGFGSAASNRWGHAGRILVTSGSPANVGYAIASIKIPFAEWVIVDVMFTWAYTAGLARANDYLFSIGKQHFNASTWTYNILGSEIDLYSKNTDNTGTYCSPTTKLYGPGTGDPIGGASRDYESGLGLYHHLCCRFRVISEAAANSSLDFGPVCILYRIKEF